MLLLACENDIERINLITDEAVVPKIKGSDIKVIYSDSARVKVQILAPYFQQFPDAEEPYMEFTEGLEVFFYNDKQEIESEIKADYAIYYINEKLWKATGNVEARNLMEGDNLKTEELFWDEAEERIYSNVYTRVQNADDILYGKGGFEAQQNLENWYLKGTSGEIVVPDEE